MNNTMNLYKFRELNMKNCAVQSQLSQGANHELLLSQVFVNMTDGCQIFSSLLKRNSAVTKNVLKEKRF